MKVYFVNSNGDYPNDFPPLGMLYLASYIRSVGHNVKFYDLGAPGALWTVFEERLKEFSPEVVGVSLYTTQIEISVSLINKIKELVPTTKIIVGGPHVSALPGATLREEVNIDVEVFGEGEITLSEYLRHYETGVPRLSEIDGLVWRNGKEIVQNSAREYIADLDSLPFPAYDLVKEFRYSRDKFAYGFRVGIIVSSRGCPYRCTFCNKAVHGSRYRRKSPGKVVEEIRLQKEILGIDEVYFVDDLFVTNKSWLEEFMLLYRTSNIGLPWRCLGRVDQVGFPVYEKMKKAGCFLVQFGIESGDNDVLKKIKKNITREQAMSAVCAARKAGLNTATYFVLGHPDDTYSTIKKTIEFAQELNADACHFFVMVPFPGTYNYTLLPDNLKTAWKRIRYYHKGEHPICLCELTPLELYKLEKQARYEFYGRGGYFLTNVLTFRFPIRLGVIRLGAFLVCGFMKSILSLSGKRVVPKLRSNHAPEC